MGMHKGLIGKSEGGGSADLTLGDYITRKQRAAAFDDVAKEKKLSFDDWLRRSSFVIPDATIYDWLSDCWKAAQENK